MCVLQVPVTAANVSARPKSGGCLETTVSVMTGIVTDMTASSAQVELETHLHAHTLEENLPKLCSRDRDPI